MTLPIKLEKAIDDLIDTKKYKGEFRTLKDSPDIISVGFVIDGKWVEIRNA